MVLVSILFILYLNELPTLKLSGSIISFADETVVFVEDTSRSVVKELLEKTRKT